MKFDELEKALKAEFPGCHVSLELYHSGGTMMVSGCEECGGDPEILEGKSWRYDGGGAFDFGTNSPKTMDECVELIKGKIS